MVKQTLEQTYKQLLDQHYLPTLKTYLTKKNSSRLFEETVSQRDVLQSLVDWIHTLELTNTMILEFKENDLPPALVVITEPVRQEKTVMMYGFLDKQPEMKCQWTDNKSAYEPVQEGNRLYGRGVSEGAGSLIATVLMLKAYQIEESRHDRIVLFFETDKNSGSCDAYYFYQKHKDLIGKPDIVYCLDGTVPNYESLYFTNSLKGTTLFDLKVSVGKTGVHSGLGGGLVPDSYRILSDLLNRIECPQTGKLCDELYTEIPDDYKKKINEFLSQVKIDYKIKYKKDIVPPSINLDNFIKNIWDSQLVNLARDNIPEVAEAGNVLRAYTTFRMKLQTNPLCDADKIQDLLNQKFKGEEALNNAKVDLDILINQDGFYQDNMCPQVQQVLDRETQKMFSKNPGYWGTGDSMPFLGQMKKANNKLQVVLTGVKSYDSKSKSGNENLNVEYAGRVYQTMFNIVNGCYSL